MLKRKILLYFTILIALSLIISGIISTNYMSKEITRHIENELFSASALSMSYFDKNITDYNELAGHIRKQYNHFNRSNHDIRVTIIDKNGVVIGETHAEKDIMLNHSNRAEIQSAMNGVPGISVRKSTTTNIDFIYLAVPVEDSDVILRLSVSLSELNIIKNRIFTYILIGFLISFVICMIIAYRLSNSITAPVFRLAKHAEKLSKGNLSERINNLSSSKELKVLSQAFNSMTEKLEAYFSQINTKNTQMDTILNNIHEGIVAVDDNNKIIIANKALLSFAGFEHTSIGESVYRIKNTALIDMILKSRDNSTDLTGEIRIKDKTFYCYSASFINLDKKCSLAVLTDLTNIKKLENLKYEFVSNVTHELNTPLTSIQGYIETLKEGAMNDKNVSMKFLDIIDFETQRLKSLINDILTLSSIESLSHARNIEKVNLYGVSTDVIHLFIQKASERNITVVNNIDKKVYVSAEYNHIKQLFINLIDNAIKYNVENGQVLLMADVDNGIVSIHFSDTGIGIDQKDSERLFERFYRVEKSRSGEIPGTGLGLSIVKHIVMLYNGNVTFSSTPGKGSEFVVQLPV